MQHAYFDPRGLAFEKVSQQRVPFLVLVFVTCTRVIPQHHMIVYTLFDLLDVLALLQFVPLGEPIHDRLYLFGMILPALEGRSDALRGHLARVVVPAHVEEHSWVLVLFVVIVRPAQFLTKIQLVYFRISLEDASYGFERNPL